MPAKNLPFSQSEYDARITRTRAEMAARNLDTIIVSDPSNMGWLTGYDGWSFYVHQCVILPMQGNPYGFLILIVISLLLTITLIWFFLKKEWF